MLHTVRLVPALTSVNLSTATPGDLYLTANGDLYRYERQDQLGGIGSFFKKLGTGLLKVAPFAVGFIPGIGGLSQALTQKIAGAVAGGASSLAGGLGGGGGGGLAKGLAGITNYGNEVIRVLSEAKNANLDGAMLSQAEALANSLSDPAKVYQAKKGKDAEALAAFKQQAGQLLNELRAKAAQQPTQQELVQQQQQQQAQGNSIFGGIDSSTILLLGGVFAAIYFFK